MVVKAYKSGATTITSDYGWDVPTNPRLTTESTFSTSTRLYTIIYPDDTTDEDITEFGGTANNPYNNLETTEGFRIKCYDSASQEGVLFNPADWDNTNKVFTTNDYFVLVHADDHEKHHFAKITEVLTMDSLGDGFEFSPKLGNEIEENTKFMIFSIPNTTPAIAISAGIKYDLQNTLYVSRPLFYFYNDKLDKDNELDHNTKYFIRLKNENASTTIDFTGTTHETTILTVQDYANTIVDYSKYSMKLELFDKLRDLDDPTNSPYLTNEGVTITKDYTDYNDIFPNAKTDLDDNNAAYERRGERRYAFYSYSPTKNNTLYNTIDANIQQSIGQRGGFAQVKLSDSFRIMPKKITNFDALRVRHAVHSGNLFEWFALSATVETDLGTNDYRILTDYDLKDFFAIGDEIRIGNTHLFIDGIGTLGSSKLQTVSCHTRTRTATDSQFTTNTFTATVGDIIYRRAFKATATANGTSNTLLTNFVMMENRYTNLFVEFMDSAFSKFVATVENTDPDKKLMTLSYDGVNYYDTLNDILEYLEGDYSIQVERLDGEIETIKSYKEDGQTFMEIEGRDKFNKLLSPIVNKDFLFSEDIIYSSISPYNKLEALTPTLTCDFDTAINSLTFSSNVDLLKGDHIFVKHANGTFAYVGEIGVTASGTNVHTLLENPLAQGSALAAYKAANKNYIFNKALSSNPFISSSTSLSGASNKGIIFNAGRNISRSSFGETLAGTSASGNGIDLGYSISNCKGIKSDNPFQATIDNETFDITNTLIDFTIFNVQEDGTNKIVKVAPYMPLSLGRIEVNYANTQDTTFRASMGTTSSAQTNSRFVETTNQTYLSTIAIPKNFHNKPLYINEVFVGFIIGVQMQTDYTTVRIYLDREVTCLSGDTLSVLEYSATYEESTKLTHELQLLNAGHLHAGKFICRLNSQLDSSRNPILFNYPLYYNTMGSNPKTHSERFGPSIYRLFNIEKGNIHTIKPVYSILANSAPNIQYYTDKASKVKYYASGYKMNFGHYISSGTLVENIIGTDIMHIAHHKMPETRGYTSVRGSNFFDTTIHALAENYNLMPYEGFTDSNSGYYTKDYLYQPDAKAARMFLFINCDLTPYSSTRFDSLMANSPYAKTMTNYSLFALKEPKTAGRSDDKDLVLGQSETINLKDRDYNSATIVSADKTISSLKRFSIMRLTEVVYDWHFNQIDPENIVSKDRTMRKFSNTEYTRTQIASVSVTITSPVGGNSAKIQYSAAVSVAANDLIYDNNGRFIGEVQSLGTTTITNDTITFKANVIETNGIQVADPPHFKTNPITNRTSDEIKGHGSEDSVILNSEIHMLKSFVVNGTGTGKYGESGSAWNTHYGSTLDNSAHAGRTPNLFLPVDLGEDARGSSNTHYSSHVIQMYRDGTLGIDDSNAFANDDLTLKDFRAIFFDRYQIEEGTRLVDKGMVSDYITGMSFSEDTVGTKLGLVAFKTDENFGENESVNKSGGSSATTADGVFMGFKPEITLPSVTSSDKSAGNKTVYYYSIQATGENHFLNYVDLTGTYLVSQEGKYYDADGGIQTSSDGQSLNDLTITDMAYVISHELDHTNTAHYHILTLDQNMAGYTCRVMQPNHTCFYSYSPKEIQLNTLSSKYTKMGNENKMYESINAYQFRDAKGTRSNDSNNEGVLSAYILLDTDNQPNLSNTIYITDYSAYATLIGNIKLEMGISDGDTSYLTSIEYKNNGDAIGHYLNFGELRELLGVVSVSETINLTVNGDITSEHKRALIGAGVQIGREAQDIVNDLLENENLQYSTDGTTSYYLAPNFQGINLFSAINLICSKINKTIFVEQTTYKLKDNQNEELYSSNIKIGDESNVKVFSFEKSSTIFDFYNEVIVYGNAHKSTRKNLKSIQKVGRKTFEYSDKTLSNQTEVDAKAKELFSLYNKNNQKIELLVNHENISTLQVGDIVNVELQQENIPFSTFLVLQMEHQLTGLIKLQLGKYSKLLEDTFAEILASTKKNETANRPTSLNSNEEQYYFLENIKINLRKLLVRKRVSTGGYTLGFSAPLNTGTYTLGFGTGTGVTLTTLVEEEY